MGAGGDDEVTCSSKWEVLDGGHFALDTKLDVIAEAVDEFLKGK
jgi:hypothetical protein